MSCKKLTARARAEQDYWLSFSDCKEATEDERLEFLRYDSHGGAEPLGNPVWLGKKRHGQYGEVLREAYFDDFGWVGGLDLVTDYIVKYPSLRPLREWFGNEAVDRWHKAYMEVK